MVRTTIVVTLLEQVIRVEWFDVIELTEEGEGIDRNDRVDHKSKWWTDWMWSEVISIPFLVQQVPEAVLPLRFLLSAYEPPIRYSFRHFFFAKPFSSAYCKPYMRQKDEGEETVGKARKKPKLEEDDQQQKDAGVEDGDQQVKEEAEEWSNLLCWTDQ